MPLVLRRSRRARRMLLKLDLQAGGVELVLPSRVTVAQALRFLEEQRDWIARRVAALPPRQPFAEGASLPLLGVPHRIRHHPGTRAGVWLEQGEIRVSGTAEHLPRRVRDWIRARAAAELSTRARRLAQRLGRTVTRVTVRDTASRWGSCTARGSLSFSWRLMLAPEEVADYVVAHEVAHLVEMNHGPRFWALVRQLAPQADAARGWLRAHGAALHRYG